MQDAAALAELSPRAGPSAWRIFAVLLVLLIALLVTFARLWSIAHPLGNFGIRIADNELTLASVAPGSPAARAGLRAGDELAREGMSLYDYYAV